MILACKTYNVFDAQGGLLVVSQVAQLGEPDVSYTTAAISTLLGPKIGGLVVSFALFFFAFTTIMAYYYYAETNLVYLFGKGRKEHVFIWILRIALIAAVFYGSLNKASLMWSLGDIGVGAMAWINIVAILLLSLIPFRALRSYERQKKAKKEPTFDPDELKIKNADFWKKKS
jgi:AGCS family alanine or glycine:cation symporter